MAAIMWPEEAPSTTELIDARRTVARRTGAFLAVHFLTGTRDLRPVLHLVRAALPLCQLPDDTAVNDVGARLETENSIRHSDRPRFLALEGGDLELHITRPSLVSWQLWACFRPLQRPALLHLWALPAWLRPLRQAWRRALLQSLVRLAQWPAARPRPVRSAARLARRAAQLRRAAAARPLWP